MITNITGPKAVTDILDAVSAAKDSKLIIFYSSDLAERMGTFPEKVLSIIMEKNGADKETIVDLVMRTKISELPLFPSINTLNFILEEIVESNIYYLIMFNDHYLELFNAIVRYESAMTDIVSKSVPESNFPWQEGNMELKLFITPSTDNEYLNKIAEFIVEDRYNLFETTEIVQEAYADEVIKEMWNTNRISVAYVMTDSIANPVLVNMLEKYVRHTYKTHAGINVVNPSSN